jgi:hypothetical protein
VGSTAKAGWTCMSSVLVIVTIETTNDIALCFKDLFFMIGNPF